MRPAQRARRLARLFPPPFLETWPLGIQVVLVGLVPIIFGLICGATLRMSAPAFIALQAVALAGGYWAGLEHRAHSAGAARGAVGGLLFGAAIVTGHQLAGGADQGLLRHPYVVQVLTTVSFGTLLGLFGARSRQRIETAMSRRRS